MTDLEKFVELYKSVGINLEPKRKEHWPDFVILELIADVTPGVEGYDGMTTTLFFDESGKFVVQNVWE